MDANELIAKVLSETTEYEHGISNASVYAKLKELLGVDFVDVTQKVPYEALYMVREDDKKNLYIANHFAYLQFECFYALMLNGFEFTGGEDLMVRTAWAEKWLSKTNDYLAEVLEIPEYSDRPFTEH